MGSNLVYVVPPCLRRVGHVFNDRNTYCVICGWVPRGFPHPDNRPSGSGKKKGFNGSAQRRAATARAVKKYGSWCHYCTIYLEEETITIDHVIPLAVGGPHEDHNFRPCCKPCNHAKGEMSEGEFRVTVFLIERQKWVGRMRAREIDRQEQLPPLVD
jgi:hypothetical protein